MKKETCPHCGHKQDKKLFYCEECREDVTESIDSVKKNSIKRERNKQKIQPILILIGISLFISIIYHIYITFYPATSP